MGDLLIEDCCQKVLEENLKEGFHADFSWKSSIAADFPCAYHFFGGVCAAIVKIDILRVPNALNPFEVSVEP